MLKKGVGMHNLVVITNPQSHFNVALKALQQKFCISYIGGETRLLDLQEIADVQEGKANAEIHYIKRQDSTGRMTRYLRSCPIAVTKTKELIQEFWVDVNTHVFNAADFTPIPQPSNILNQWIPPTVSPQQGNWNIIEDYLLNVICSDDLALYEYVCGWLAHAYQRPEEKPGVIIVLLGDEGVGKGFFIRLLEIIWSRTTLQVSDINRIIGNFNKALETTFIVALDEAVFQGDKKSQDRLKSLITEPTIQIEQKFEPSRTITSVHRYIACTNHDHFSNIRADDRRGVYVRVSNSQKQNTNYFGKLSAALNDGYTVSAFVYELATRDLSNFNPRERPKTSEQFEQKRRSLDGVSRYWFEVLLNGDFSTKGYNDCGYFSACFQQNGKILEWYKDYDRTAEKYESLQVSTIHHKIKQICPSADINKRKDNKRGIEFPSLDTARKEFEDWMDFKIRWID
jgi:hypothetical protein